MIIIVVLKLLYNNAIRVPDQCHEIELETGLDFFSGMPPEVQKQLEAKTAAGMW